LSLNDFSRLRQGLCRLTLTLGMYDLGPLFSFSFSLLGNRPDHIFWKIHMLHFNQLDLDSPGISMLIDYFLKSCIKLFSF
jgi:hypothetical protein